MPPALDVQVISAFASVSFLLILAFTIILKLIQKWRISDQREAQLRGNLKSVPMVKGNGWIPLIGHGLSFVWDSIGFLRRCEEAHGSIFKIQLFNSNAIVVTDPEVVTELMENASNFAIFERIYLSNVYDCSKLPFQDMLRVVTGNDASWKEIKVNFENETKDLIQRLSWIPGRKVDIRAEIRVFIANSNARILLGETLSKKCFSDLAEFFKLFNIVIMLSYTLSKVLSRLLLQKRLCHLRDAAATGFFLLIQKYREDPNLNEAHILRSLVDYTEEGIGRESLSDIEIGRILVILLHMATEIRVIAFNSVLAEVFLHPEIWTKCKSEVEKFGQLNSDRRHLESMDFEGLMASEYLDAVILESARLNAEIFPVHRKSIPELTNKGYYVGDAEILGVSSGLLRVSGNFANNRFPGPDKFNPDRFLCRTRNDTKLNVRKPADLTALITWGARIRGSSCPGRCLAFAQIKVALTVVLLAIRMEDVQIKGWKCILFPRVLTDRCIKTVFNFAR